VITVRCDLLLGGACKLPLEYKAEQPDVAPTGGGKRTRDVLACLLFLAQVLRLLLCAANLTVDRTDITPLNPLQ